MAIINMKRKKHEVRQVLLILVLQIRNEIYHDNSSVPLHQLLGFVYNVLYGMPNRHLI